MKHYVTNVMQENMRWTTRQTGGSGRGMGSTRGDEMKDFPFDKNDPPVIDQEVMDQIKKDWAESIVCEDGQWRKIGSFPGVPYIRNHGLTAHNLK